MDWFLYDICLRRERDIQKSMNQFYVNVSFLYPLKTSGFLTFLGGIEMKH